MNFFMIIHSFHEIGGGKAVISAATTFLFRHNDVVSIVFSVFPDPLALIFSRGDCMFSCHCFRFGDGVSNIGVCC